MPLNQRLFNRINRLLPGGVRRIAKEGELAELHEVRNVRTMQYSTRRLAGGEEYVVDCPFCGDSKGHLYINYRYGEFDECTGSENAHLAICFRRDCIKDPDNRAELRDKLCNYLLATRPVEARRAPIVRDSGRLSPVQAPGDILPIETLSPSHYAVRYLTERGYDIQELAKLWQVGVCTDARDRNLIGRIYMPIYQDDQLVGWQARWPADIDWKANGLPKYYNLPSMPRRLMLYNYDLAKESQVVVICEGVTDVWRVGVAGVALLGKTMSPQQTDLVVKTWGEHVIIICLDSNDPDAARSAEDIYNRLLPRVRGCLVNARLPDGLDPGSCQRDYLWDFLRDQVNRSVKREQPVALKTEENDGSVLAGL